MTGLVTGLATAVQMTNVSPAMGWFVTGFSGGERNGYTWHGSIVRGLDKPQ